MGAYPASVSTFTVVGRLHIDEGDGIDVGTDPDVNPQEGVSVTFTPQLNPKRIRVPGFGLVDIAPVAAVTDADGYVKTIGGEDVVLAYGGDPDITPTGWTWLVSIEATSVVPEDEFSIAGSAGGTVDLSEFASVSPADPGAEVVAWVSARDAAIAAKDDAEAAQSAAETAQAAAEDAQAAAEAVPTSNDGIVAGLVADSGSSTRGALDAAYVPHQDTAPDETVTTVWADTSTEPPTMKGWDGSAWVAIGGGAGGIGFIDNGNGTLTLSMTADIYSKDGADEQFVHVVGSPMPGQVPVWNDSAGQWEPGEGSGSGVPDGGTTGQSLVKTSDTNGDAEWADRVATVNGLAPVDGNVNTAVLPGPLEKTPIYAYGHSYLIGIGTSGGRDIVSRLTQRTGTAVTNRALTGASVSVALNRMHNLDGSASASVWVPGTKGVILFDSVTNDGRRSPDAAFTQDNVDAYQEMIRSVVRIGRSSSRVLHSDATVVKTGFASTYSSYVYSASPSDLIVITPGGAITDLWLWSALMDVAKTTRGFEVSTDGGSTWEQVEQPGQAITGIGAWLYHVTIPEGGTVRIRPYGGRSAFFAGYWVDHNPTPPSFILCTDPTVSDVGMAPGTPNPASPLSPTQWATAVANQNALNDSIVALLEEDEFSDGTVRVADPRPGFDYETDISSDFLHPNAIGYWKYANAIQIEANQLTLRNGMTPV